MFFHVLISDTKHVLMFFFYSHVCFFTTMLHSVVLATAIGSRSNIPGQVRLPPLTEPRRTLFDNWH